MFPATGPWCQDCHVPGGTQDSQAAQVMLRVLELTTLGVRTADHHAFQAKPRESIFLQSFVSWVPDV